MPAGGLHKTSLLTLLDSLPRKESALSVSANNCLKSPLTTHYRDSVCFGNQEFRKINAILKHIRKSLIAKNQKDLNILLRVCRNTKTKQTKIIQLSVYQKSALLQKLSPSVKEDEPFFPPPGGEELNETNTQFKHNLLPKPSRRLYS